MNDKEFDHVRACIENEGFEYAFTNYSNFTGEAGGEGPESLVEDEEFHKRRLAYLEARKRLAEYVGWEL